MKVEYINPFIQASTSIINQTTGFNVKLGKVNIKNPPYKSDNVLVLIGLTGEIQGNVVISFSTESAIKVASAMMFGMPVKELDDISKSAIAELCNMILGNTATLFSKSKINIDITPPTIFTGENLELSIHKSVIVSIPLIFEDGNKIEIDISYVDN